MAKNIVFCADGTWNHPREEGDKKTNPTNVYKLYESLPKSADQVTFYDDGVGVGGGIVNELLGGITGEGLFKKVKDGYRKIAVQYQDGDNIHLFGFSRGAYTARSIAGMIAFCGIPAPEKLSETAIEDSFAAYRERDPERRKAMLAALKTKYGNRDVSIAQVGVWDTVGAMGIPGKLFQHIDAHIYGFLDTTLKPNVKAAWQALSIDEKRPAFTPSLWSPPAPGQDMDQVWFAGVHSDVGGGYPEPCLSDIPLGWMMKKAASKGLVIDPVQYKKYTELDPNCAAVKPNSSWNPITSPWWGLFPKPREIPPGSTIASSVAMLMAKDPTYRPENLKGSFVDRVNANGPAIPASMRIENVIAPFAVQQTLNVA